MSRQQRGDESGSYYDSERGGFTCFPNKLLDTLALARLTACETRCLLFLLRKTYGWHKREETISLAEWALGTGMDPKQRHNVLRTLRGLLAKHVIYAKTNGSNRPLTWGINNNVEEWDKALFIECHASMRGVAGLTDQNATIITDDNATVLADDNTTGLTDENTTVLTGDNALYKRKKVTAQACVRELIEL